MGCIGGLFQARGLHLRPAGPERRRQVITDAVAKALISVACWSVPHELTSDLQRQILQLQIDTGELRFGGQNPIDRLPDASGAVDISFWFAYVVAICVVLFWSVRRKQV